jgi:Ca2+-binding RTX toxin-like protein
MRRRTLAIAALVPLFISSFPATSFALSLPACSISGTAFADRINGTPGDDVICAGAGNDIVNGLGGNDIIYGGTGNDRILGGTGKDAIYGEAGTDNIDGGLGADEINGGPGNDSVLGGSGRDLIKGEDGSDSLNGGIDADMITGGLGKDMIRTGPGDDLCNKDSVDVMLDPCVLDRQAPEIGANTAVVRTFEAGSNLKLTWSISDASGVEKSYASIGGAPGWITSWCGFRIEGQLVSGDAKNGTYQINCQIPDNAVNDNYSLFVGAHDVLGNSTINSPIIAFTVIGGASDSKAPKVEKVDIAKSVSSGEEFSMTLGVTDETGVNGVYGWFMLDGGGFASWTGNGSHVNAKGAAELVNGTTRDGDYRQSFKFSDKAPAGSYTLWLSLRDELGNKTFEATGVKIRYSGN